jgi:hypothetical protein
MRFQSNIHEYTHEATSEGHVRSGLSGALHDPSWQHPRGALGGSPVGSLGRGVLGGSPRVPGWVNTCSGGGGAGDGSVQLSIMVSPGVSPWDPPQRITAGNSRGVPWVSPWVFPGVYPGESRWGILRVPWGVPWGVRQGHPGGVHRGYPKGYRRDSSGGQGVMTCRDSRGLLGVYLWPFNSGRN